jgi:hypothetical protein
MHLYITEKTRIIIRLIGILTLLLFPGVAFAQDEGEVIVNGRVVFRLAGEGKSDAEERARLVQDRIDSLIGSTLGPSDVKAVKDKAGIKIMWGTELIVIVTPQQAKLNKSKPESLAALWTKNLKEAIDKGAFYLNPGTVEMPINTMVTVKALGNAKGQIVKEYDTGNVGVYINQEDDTIQIRGSGLGSSKIVFRRGEAKTHLYVKILDYPAYFPDKIETEVAGDPAPKEVLQFAARNACINNIKLKPGARIETGENIRVEVKLEKGKTLLATVPVTIKGEGYFTVNQDVQVAISNIGEGFSESKQLMVSDRPERISQDGILFYGKFDQYTPSRLLYYHQNADRVPRRLWIELKNTSNETVQIMTGGAMSGPDRYGTTVGHAAAMRILETYQKGLGYSIHIPPGKSAVIIDMQLGVEQIVCGYTHLQIRKGKEVEVYVKNSSTLEGDSNGKTMTLLTQPFDPFKIHPKGIFTPANIDEEIEYNVAEDDNVSMSIGLAPWLIDAVSGEPNNGNYGVFYRFKVRLKNPTPNVKRIGFYFVPKGNLARGSFIIDGRLMETILVRYPTELIFAAIDLKPNSEKVVEIVTTPEGGSYYPVELILKPADNSAVIQTPGQPAVESPVTNPTDEKSNSSESRVIPLVQNRKAN